MAKTLIIVVVIVALTAVSEAISDTQKERAYKHVEKCIAITGESQENVNRLMRADSSIRDEKCFGRCFFQQAGFMNVNGEFLEEETVQILSTSSDRMKVEALVNTCKIRHALTVEEPCEMAYQLFRCYVTHKAF